jgi:hypothetical protein
MFEVIVLRVDELLESHDELLDGTERGEHFATKCGVGKSIDESAKVVSRVRTGKNLGALPVSILLGSLVGDEGQVVIVLTIHVLEVLVLVLETMLAAVAALAAVIAAGIVKPSDIGVRDVTSFVEFAIMVRHSSGKSVEQRKGLAG